MNDYLSDRLKRTDDLTLHDFDEAYMLVKNSDKKLTITPVLLSYIRVFNDIVEHEPSINHDFIREYSWVVVRDYYTKD
jgi:hypothetical protein